jgi:hypothetical protein
VGVLQDTYVDTNGIRRIDGCESGLLGLLVGFDTEGRVPIPRSVPFDTDLFNGRVLGDLPVVRYRYLADFAQSEPVAPRIPSLFAPSALVEEEVLHLLRINSPNASRSASAH